TLGAVEDGHVAKVLGVLGLSALLEDPRFADRAARAAHADAMAQRMAAVLATRPAADWEAAFRRVGVPA
ncbi:MAG: CoA transferase, partial [Rhodobacteraceae bacterium]|nr:CoA transferase [Paracoccaceae bacterium]